MDALHDHAEGRVSVDALFRVHASFVAGFLHRFGAAPQDIDDMVQEVFIIAHRKGGYVNGPARPRTWLATIAVHIAQSSRRARVTRERNARPMSDDVLERAADSVDPSRQLEAQRAVQRVQRALEDLPAEHRAAFMRHEFEGETCESIAAEWQVPVGTVYSRLHTARRRVLEAYGEYDMPDAARRQDIGSRSRITDRA